MNNVFTAVDQSTLDALKDQLFTTLCGVTSRRNGSDFYAKMTQKNCVYPEKDSFQRGRRGLLSTNSCGKQRPSTKTSSTSYRPGCPDTRRGKPARNSHLSTKENDHQSFVQLGLPRRFINNIAKNPIIQVTTFCTAENLGGSIGLN